MDRSRFVRARAAFAFGLLLPRRPCAARAQDPAGRRTADRSPGRPGAAPRDLRPVARRGARRFADRQRQRPHRLRFRRQCLPGLFAGIPPGLRARHRRRQSTSTSDLRSTTWEGADAKSFKFTSQNFVDQSLVDSVDGHAEHDAAKTAVDLDKPQQKTSISTPASCSRPST